MNLQTKVKSELLHSIHPVLIFCRILGFLPVQFYESSIEFKWLSIPAIYTVAVAIFSSYLSTLNISLQTFELSSALLPLLSHLGVPTNDNNYYKTIQNYTKIERGPETLPEIIPLDTSVLSWSFFKVLFATILTFVFQCFVVVAFFCARKIPEYYSKLEKNFHAIFIGLPRTLERWEETERKRSHVITQIKTYTVRSIGFYGLLMILNLIFVTLDTMKVLNSAEYHPLMYTGYFIWQIFFASHVLVSVLGTVFILVLKISFQEINEQFEKLIQFQTKTGDDDANDDNVEQESKSSDDTARNKNNKNFSMIKMFDTDSEWKSKDVRQKNNNIWSKKIRTSRRYPDVFFDGQDRKDIFPIEFRRLKMAFLELETLVIAPGFIASGFIFMEFIIAVFNIICIALANYDNVWTGVDVVFQSILHSFFLFRFILNASTLSCEAQRTLKILLELPFKNIPIECHSEIEVFTTKILVSGSLAISVLRVKVNTQFLSTVKTVGTVIVIFVAFVVYLVAILITIVSQLFKIDLNFEDFVVFNASSSPTNQYKLFHLFDKMNSTV